MKQIRKVRHWKQRFDPNVAMIFRKRIKWDVEKTFMPGQRVPDGLLDRNKLRRWWEFGLIELAQFEAPNVATGVVDNPLPDGVTVEKLKGNWRLVRTPAEPDGIKVNGKKKLGALLDELRAAA